MLKIFERNKTREVTIGTLKMGGENPILIQSMTTTKPRNVEKTVEQILTLEKVGCEIIRVAVPTMEDAKVLRKIKKRINIPLVADIHFDYRLALEAIHQGVDKLRINPGNIGDKVRVKKVVNAAQQKNIPIRIGVNGGSLEKELLEKYKKPTAEAMVESAMRHIELLEGYDFKNIVVSLKSSSIEKTVKAYQLMAVKRKYPLHIGITEAGTKYGGTIKSSAGIGILLALGLGDTLRVSLTGDPIEEVKAGKEILKALGLRNAGVKVIACPTCGRCNINLEKIALEVEKMIATIDKNITVAIMGCAVNGPGEAREADIGIAGGKNKALLFKKGQIIREISEENIISELLNEIKKL